MFPWQIKRPFLHLRYMSYLSWVVCLYSAAVIFLHAPFVILLALIAVFVPAAIISTVATEVQTRRVKRLTAEIWELHAAAALDLSVLDLSVLDPQDQEAIQIARAKQRLGE